MLIIKEMIESEVILKELLESQSSERMLINMITRSSDIDSEDLSLKIENLRRTVKKSIALYIQEHKDELLNNIKDTKELKFEFNSVDTLDRVNSLETNVLRLDTQIIKPYQNLRDNLVKLKSKADDVRLMDLLHNLSTYYEYGSEFTIINDSYILGK